MINYFFNKKVLTIILGQFGTIAAQALMFLMIARSVGPEEFGKLAGVTSIVGILMPFVGLGMANVMMVAVAKYEKDVNEYYVNALLMGLFSAATLIFSLYCIEYLFGSNGEQLKIFFIISCSEFIFTKIADITQHIYYGKDEFNIYGQPILMQNLCRMAAAFYMFIAYVEPTATDWAVLSLGSGIISGVLILIQHAKYISINKLSIKILKNNIYDGFMHSVSISTRSVYTDFDKVVMQRVGGNVEVGNYTVAYRIVNMISIPISSLILSEQAKMLKMNNGKNYNIFKEVKKITIIGLVYSGVAAVALVMFAPYAKILVGERYSEIGMILPWIGLILAPVLLQNLICQVLMADGKNEIRVKLQMSSAVLSVLLNIALVPGYGWAGAIAVAVVVNLLIFFGGFYFLAKK